MLTQYQEELRKQFLKYFDQNEQLFSKGKNRLSFEMALDLTKEILLKELTFVKSLTEPLFIEQLEGRFELELSFDIHQQTVPIKFVGYIDRIDRIGEKYRVIDYKSGKAAAQDVKFTEKNDALTNLSKPKHTLQLSLYCLFFQEKFGFLPQEARIESLINRDENFALNIEKQQGLSRVPELINEGLTALLTELLDPTINFGHDTGSKYCQFCN
jgi:hypothetical protein